MIGAAMTKVLHGKAAKVEPRIAMWKSAFPTLLEGDT